MLRGRLFLPALAAALAACGGGHRVYVTYPKPATPEARALTRALGNLYLLLRVPPMPQESLVGRAALRTVRRVEPLSALLFEVDARRFADELQRGFSGRGGQVLAYRVLPGGGGEDPFLERLAPSGLLSVDFRSLELDRREVEQDVVVRDSEGKSEKRKAKYLHFTARLRMEVVLKDYPGGRVLAQGVRVAEFAKALPFRGSMDERAFYREHQGPLMAAAARAAAEGLHVAPVVRRHRNIRSEKKEPLSARALKAARRGEWEEASRLWAERLDAGKGGWLDWVNLAIAAEVRQEFAEARRLYEKALEASGADVRADAIRWQVVFSDLDDAVDAVGIRSRSAVEWFQSPVAVLPFTDDTMSIDGPRLLRELTAGALRDGGYEVLPVEDVDRGLRRLGVSQGADIRTRPPAEMAKAVGAGRLVFGHVDQYREIMLGPYGRRVVAGRLSLRAPESGAALWSSDRPVVREEAAEKASEEQAAAMFAGQLLRGLFERVAGKPLGREAAQFVRQNLQTLPQKP